MRLAWSAAAFRLASDRTIAHDTFRAALILLLVLNIEFFPFIWGKKTFLESAQFCASVLPKGAWAGKPVDVLRYGKTLDPAAAAWFMEPSMAITGSQYLQNKTLPLWNPYQAFGTPYAADMQSQPFYPLAILFSLHLTPRTYNLFILCRLFVAGVFAYLYLRLFVSFTPALASGIAAMLSGYYVLFISLPYLSVETLIPAALLAAEILIRKTSHKSMWGFAFVFLLAIVGGMPESSLLLFAFVYAYMAFRLVFDSDLRRGWFKRTLYVLGASLLGISLAAFLLIPLLEFMRHSYNTHQPPYIHGVPGLTHDPFGLSILTYIFPLLFGEPFAGTLPEYADGIRNYVGIVAIFIVLVAAFCLIRPMKRRNCALVPITYFFLATIAIVLLKRYGFPPINMLGKLPLFRMVLFPKYDEPILSISVAAVCGIGLERILKNEASLRIQVTALIVAFLVIPSGVMAAREVLIKELRTGHVLPAFPAIAIGLPVCLLFCLAICCIAFKSRLSVGSGASRACTRFTIAISVLLVAEMSLNYIPELYYAFNSLPDISENPFLGAPYIEWLKSRVGADRIFGRESELIPDWASVFQLADIRDLDALYYKKYLPFIRNFFLQSRQSTEDELRDRFTGGTYDYSFAVAAQRRLLQLTSVRYLLTRTPYEQPSFRLAYDRELKIYTYDDVLPRAALYYRAEIAKDESEVLQKLANPNFDIYRTVLLDATKLRLDQRFRILYVNQGPSRPVEAQAITSYEPQTVEISASPVQSGILVLNDSDYPGWTVQVDGRPAEWFTANYIFRGVLLGPGRHHIRFSYRPRSFYLGAAISLLTLLVPMLWSVRRRLFRANQAVVAQP